MAQVFWFLLITPALAFSNLPPPPPSGCPSKCGCHDIPYPFGIDPDNNCSWHGAFNLTCNTSLNPPRLYVGNVEVVNISLEAGEMRVNGSYSHVCSSNNNRSNSGTGGTSVTDEAKKSILPIVTDPDSGSGPDSTTPAVADFTTLNLTQSPYLISAGRNEFTAIGCNTLALLKDREDWSYNTGCITYCTSLDEAAHDGNECTGLGCCQTSISDNLTMIEVSWSKGTIDNNPAQNYSPVAMPS